MQSEEHENHPALRRSSRNRRQNINRQEAYTLNEAQAERERRNGAYYKIYFDSLRPLSNILQVFVKLIVEWSLVIILMRTVAVDPPTIWII